MPPHSALLSCVLCLQVRDRNLCCCGAFSPRPFRRARKRRVLSELLALRRLQIPARDIESSRRGYDNPRAHPKHTAVVRTPARGTRTTVVVNLYHSRKSSEFAETPSNIGDAARSRKSSSANRTAVSREL